MAMPPSRPPGSPYPGENFETVRCPYCGELTELKVGNRYYCPNDDSLFTKEESERDKDWE
jgi:hypothetical protein